MWNILDYLMNQKFCDESTIRAELGKISRTFLAERCVLMVHRREEIVRSLALVHDNDPKKAINLENWLYESSHRCLHDFTFTLRRLAILNKWAKTFHESPINEHNSDTIYRDENEAIVVELFLRNTETNNSRDNEIENSRVTESILTAKNLVRVLFVNKYFFKNLPASYEAYIILIKNATATVTTEKDMPVEPDEERIKQLLEPISTMIACSAPVIVQDRVDTHVKHKGSIGDLLNIQFTPSESRDQPNDDTGKQYLRKALETFRTDRMERENTHAISDLTILAYNDPREAKSNKPNDTLGIDTVNVFNGIEVDTNEANIGKKQDQIELAKQLLQCRSPKFAIARQRPLLFCRRTSKGEEVTDDKNEHSFEFSVKDIEEKTGRKISSLLVIPYESLSIKYLLIAIHYLGKEPLINLNKDSGASLVKDSRVESFFNLDDLSLGSDTLRALSWNFQREKERLAFGKLQQMLREPLSITGEDEKNTPNGAPNTDDADIYLTLPHEYRKVCWSILDLIKIAQEATSASAIRLSFLNPSDSELKLSVAIENGRYYPTLNRSTKIDLSDNSNYSRCLRSGKKIYDFDRLDELNPFYNSALLGRAEMCLPIYVYGFVVGILELNHPSIKGLSQWEDFLDLVCVGVGYYLILAREDIDSSLIANLGDTIRLHHLRNHVLDFLQKLKKFTISLNSTSLGSEYDDSVSSLLDDSVSSLLKEASEFAYPVKPKFEPRKVIDITFKCGTRDVSLADSKRMNHESTEERNIPANLHLTPQSSNIIDLVMDGISQNIFSYGFKSNDPKYSLEILYDQLLLGGKQFIKLAFINTVKRYPADSDEDIKVFNTRVYREPYEYNDDVHLGCYIVGKLVRDAGGDIYGEFDNSKQKIAVFTTHLLLPVIEAE